MGNNRRRSKKQFTCGHKGFGQYCHKCLDEKGKRFPRGKLDIVTIKEETGNGPASIKG